MNFLSLDFILTCSLILFFVAFVFALELGLRKITDGNISAKVTSMRENLKLLGKIGIAALLLFIIGWSIYQAIKGTPWEAHVLEWMNLIIRWAHFIFGVAWIGASFYFIFLENALNRKEDLRDELAGNLWAIHGGGFYYVEKYKIAPKVLPKHLHWFKWEAYFTWITGVSLLAVVYYFNAKSVLIDPNVRDLSVQGAIAISAGALFISWFIYDLLCKSSLVENKFLFFIIMFLYITFAAWFFSQMFSARAAYIHVGAVIGTLMVGNVFRVIIPSQKEMVKAAQEHRPLNPELGRHAGLRSLHNNYFTLPVLFIMISNHFPSTYGSKWNWMVLAGLVLCSAAIKHYLNLIDQGKKNSWIVPVASLGIMSIAFITGPSEKSSLKPGETKKEIPFYQAYRIITFRCTPCHSANPTDDVNTIAPNNVMFDTPAQIQNWKDRILNRAVITKTMPQANKSGMTDLERETLGLWIEQGAKIDF